MLCWSRKILKNNLFLLNCDFPDDVRAEEIRKFYNRALFIPDFSLLKKKNRDGKEKPEEIYKDCEQNAEDVYDCLMSFPDECRDMILNFLDDYGEYFLKDFCAGNVDYDKFPKQLISDRKLKENSLEGMYSIFDYDNCPFNFFNVIYRLHLINRDRLNRFPSSCCYYDFLNKFGYVNVHANGRFTLENMVNHEIIHLLSLMHKCNLPFLLDEAHPIYAGIYADRYLYGKTEKDIYNISIVNYYCYLERIIASVYFSYSMKSLGSSNSYEEFLDKVCKKFDIDSHEASIMIRYNANSNILQTLKYFVSGLASMHMLSFDQDKGNALFVKSLCEKSDRLDKMEFRDLTSDQLFDSTRQFEQIKQRVRK